MAQTFRVQTHFLTMAAAALLSAVASTHAGEVAVGVSIAVDQPGLYGRVDIGNVPPPRVIYARPILIQPPPPTVVVQDPEPLYLHVPPGHARNWRKHCREYGACGRPVYFVQDRWYNEVYVPARREYRQPGERHERQHGEGRDHDDGHGEGRGNGHDHDRGHDQDR